MRKTITISQQTDDYLQELRAHYQDQLHAERISEGWVIGIAMADLYEKLIKKGGKTND